MSTRSGRVRSSVASSSPSRNRKVSPPTRSPARSRKSSSERVSTRQSPARKSPSRKSASKYPARKSPSRTVKEKEDSVPKSPAKRPALNTNPEVKLEDFSSKFEIYRSTRSKRIEYSIGDVLKASEEVNGADSTDSSEYSLRNRKVTDVPPRRSSRLREFVESVPDIRRSISKSLSKSISKSVSKTIDSYSDDENEILKEKSSSVTRKLSTPLPSNVPIQINNRFEFGGVLGAGILILAIPLIVFSIILSCSKTCTHKALLDSALYRTKWVNLQASAVITSQYLLQALILTLPVLGTKEIDGTGRKYCFNAFFSTIVTLNILITLDFYDILKSKDILASYVQLGVISYGIAFILSVLLFLKSRKANELNMYGNTGSLVYDFFMGREIHPQIKRFNVKLWSYRICNVSTLILLLLLFKNSFYLPNIENINSTNYKDVISKIQYRPTILVFTMMQILYTLQYIIKEYKVISTFYWQYEGMGYLQLVSSAVYPFYFTTMSKYIVDNDISLRTNTLMASTVIFLLGFVIMYVSNNIKYEFRKDPLQQSLVHLDSMPTFHGKKLLTSHLWGLVRHPNYLGDILVHIALSIPGLLYGSLSAIPAILPILILIHRSWRDHYRCSKRYGAAWHRYCKRVPAVLVPKIL